MDITELNSYFRTPINWNLRFTRNNLISPFIKTGFAKEKWVLSGTATLESSTWEVVPSVKNVIAQEVKKAIKTANYNHSFWPLIVAGLHIWEGPYEISKIQVTNLSISTEYKQDEETTQADALPSEKTMEFLHKEPEQINLFNFLPETKKEK